MIYKIKIDKQYTLLNDFIWSTLLSNSVQWLHKVNFDKQFTMLVDFVRSTLKSAVYSA